MRFLLIIALCGSLAHVATAQDQQLGARTKAMGGSYTAFEDDPVSVWLNPAGIATQPDQMSLAYQTYTTYPVDEQRVGGVTQTSVRAETVLVAPAVLPSYAGFVFQLGDADHPMAIGFCYARPYHLGYALAQVTDPLQTTFIPASSVEQSFTRIRGAFAKDFRFRKPGEAGFFPHVAIGVGADVGFEQWDFRQTSGDKSDTAAALGFGGGVLIGVYDNAESLKVNLGVAYQSAIHYTFSIEPDILPAFNMPQQLNAGVTVYFLSGTPLRFTFDFQWIDWSATAETPLFANHPEFEDAVNFSVGAEYRISLSENVMLYPRVGYRRFDAPWGDPKNLPMTGGYKLVLDTQDEAFHLLTFGVGVSWATSGGKVRAVDVAGDIGGDSFNLAIGYTHEF